MSDEEDLESLEHDEDVPYDALPKDGEWLLARKYLAALGDASALFTGCSRSLVQCSEHGDKYDSFAGLQLTRLLKSPSMLAQIFFAAKTYYPKEITSRGSIEPADFAFFMKPYELALIIAIGYSTRRMASVVNQADWEILGEPFQRYVDLSVPLGLAIPEVGPARALMAGAGRYLGWALFNYKEAEAFKKYRVANKVQKRTFNLKEEIKLFGTTHLHISSLIWQSFGFGVKTCEDYFAGLSDVKKEDLTPAGVRFRVARLWLESLIETGAPPKQNLGDDFDIEDAQSEKFIEVLENFKSTESQLKWLTRNRNDISEEKTPDLAVDYEAMRKMLRKRGRGSRAIVTDDEEKKSE